MGERGIRERKEGGKEEREEKRKACCGCLSASSHCHVINNSINQINGRWCEMSPFMCVLMC